MVRDYNLKFFRNDNMEEQSSVGSNDFPSISDNLLLQLKQPFTRENIKKALFDVAPFKPPSIDGFRPGFYQNSWDVVGESLCKFVLYFINSGTLSKGTNDTLLVLIPKVRQPENLSIKTDWFM